MTTKLELQQRLDAALRENEALRVKLSQAEGTIIARRNKAPARSAYVPQPPSAEQVSYRAYQQRMREEAIADGRSVRVLSFNEWRQAMLNEERVDA